MSTTFYRQNDQKALRLLQASRYAGRKEKNVKYFQMFISIAVCIIGIFFRYANQIGIKLDAKEQEIMSNWLVLISGVVIILNLFFSIYAKRLHIEETNLLESYDNYVFGLPENIMIMRHISEITIDNYASKYAKKSKKFRNHYFSHEIETDDKNCIFENRRNEFFNAYKAITNIKSILQCLWVGFFIAIIAISANFNDNFVNTLLNILIPSLSVITLIVASWHNMIEDSKALQTAITNLNNFKEKATGKNVSINLNSIMLLRAIQDGLFAYRLRSFMIPEILSKIFTKKSKTVITTKKAKTKKEPPKKSLVKNDVAKKVVIKSEPVKVIPTKKEAPVKAAPKTETPRTATVKKDKTPAKTEITKSQVNKKDLAKTVPLKKEIPAKVSSKTAASKTLVKQESVPATPAKKELAKKSPTKDVAPKKATIKNK